MTAPARDIDRTAGAAGLAVGCEEHTPDRARSRAGRGAGDAPDPAGRKRRPQDRRRLGRTWRCAGNGVVVRARLAACEETTGRAWRRDWSSRWRARDGEQEGGGLWCQKGRSQSLDRGRPAVLMTRRPAVGWPAQHVLHLLHLLADARLARESCRAGGQSPGPRPLASSTPQQRPLEQHRPLQRSPPSYTDLGTAACLTPAFARAALTTPAKR